MTQSKSKGRWRAALIAGPTASGKSALALDLAAATGGIVINADSMQVYRDLRIITARPSRDDEARAPHWLYGHVDAAENYSVGQWLRDVEARLADAEKEGRLPILVGGTGLYFRMLTNGLAAIPPVPAEIRARWRQRLAEEGAAALHAELSRHDPAVAARLGREDRSRIVRALEVLDATGRPLSEWQRENPPPLLDAEQTARIFVAPDRDTLRDRIESRFTTMLAAGALEEVAALYARWLDPLLPAMKAHGVPWLIRHLEGAISLNEAAAQGTADTRRYAKRQFTWCRNQLPGWPWAAPDEALEILRRQLAA